MRRSSEPISSLTKVAQDPVTKGKYLALRVDNLHVWRGDAHVLRGVSFELQPGTCLQVRGSNGAGKTTLLRTLCGLIEPEEGTIRWRERDTRAERGDFHGELFYLAHDAPLKPDLTGWENLEFTVGLRRSLGRAELERVLERVGAGRFAARLTRTLSAGQRRRLGLAMLLLAQATLWVLDEPTTSLDTQGQTLVGELLTEHVERGGMVIAAVHQALGVPAERLAQLALEAR